MWNYYSFAIPEYRQISHKAIYFSSSVQKIEFVTNNMPPFLYAPFYERK
jgi:hypothetical protein